MTKEIARLIVLAQAASDAGKGIDTMIGQLKVKLQNKPNQGYYYKDQAILDAIRLIAAHHFQDVHFFVCKDEEKKAKYLVYFDIKFGGQRLQISFHSFDGRLRPFIKRNKNSWTAWDHGSSRENALLLAEHFNMI